MKSLTEGQRLRAAMRACSVAEKRLAQMGS
jgi:hypothetical protein